MKEIKIYHQGGANLKEELSPLLFQVKLLDLFNFTDTLLHLCSAKTEKTSSRCNHSVFCNTKDKITQTLTFTLLREGQMIFRSDGP